MGRNGHSPVTYFLKSMNRILGHLYNIYSYVSYMSIIVILSYFLWTQLKIDCHWSYQGPGRLELIIFEIIRKKNCLII